MAASEYISQCLFNASRPEKIEIGLKFRSPANFMDGELALNPVTAISGKAPFQGE
jgi:hypothetical protein